MSIRIFLSIPFGLIVNCSTTSVFPDFFTILSEKTLIAFSALKSGSSSFMIPKVSIVQSAVKTEPYGKNSPNSPKNTLA